MLFNTTLKKNLLRTSFILLAPIAVFFTQTFKIEAKIVVEQNSSLGIIKGIVRDEQGNPISNAIVAVFQIGSSRAFKQVRSAFDGRFLTKVLPGKYTILAVAQGYNASTVNDVQIGRSTELNYGFKLEKVGSGNTLPEKTIDRNSSKWRIRAAQSRRSIYQNDEGDAPIAENKQDTEETISVADDRETRSKRHVQSVVETYFADSEMGGFTGFNFATIQPLNDNTEIIFAGQTGTKSFAPGRLEAIVKTRPNDNHQIRISTSVSKIGTMKIAESEKQLGQVSLQALDEWKVREGVILVFGVDYSRFFGAGDDSSLTPRFGLQVDLNSKTRVKTAFTTQTEEKTWSDAIEFEGSQVLFRQQFEPKSIALEEGKPQMNKTRRLEFGLERILDNKSSVETTAFFDSVVGRGIGLTNMPINALNAESFNQIDATQQGKSQGFRVVYSRRINKLFSTSAGYSFGTGQKLSPDAVTNPANMFEDGLFQTFVGQLNTDLKTGTNVRTIFRLSPQATVFAIDPFQGRLAIFDPGLSVLVTQSLPNLGLPFRATAVIDARNILDFQIGVHGEEGSLKLSSQRRILRGGISVRF